jgi:hypothetical protein
MGFLIDHCILLYLCNIMKRMGKGTAKCSVFSFLYINKIIDDSSSIFIVLKIVLF